MSDILNYYSREYSADGSEVNQCEVPLFRQKLNAFEEVLAPCEATFYCEFESGYEPIVFWYKDDQPVDQNRCRVEVDELATGFYTRLTIRKTTTDDSGAYRCVIENIEGVISTTGYLSVTSFDNITGDGSKIAEEEIYDKEQYVETLKEVVRMRKNVEGLNTRIQDARTNLYHKEDNNFENWKPKDSTRYGNVNNGDGDDVTAEEWDEHIGDKNIYTIITPRNSQLIRTITITSSQSSEDHPKLDDVSNLNNEENTSGDAFNYNTDNRPTNLMNNSLKDFDDNRVDELNDENPECSTMQLHNDAIKLHEEPTTTKVESNQENYVKSLFERSFGKRDFKEQDLKEKKSKRNTFKRNGS